jgi:hypothetical protein
MPLKITLEVCDRGALIKTEVAYLERADLSNETCGLTMT